MDLSTQASFSLKDALSISVGLASLIGLIYNSIKFSRATKDHRDRQLDHELKAEKRLLDIEQSLSDLSARVDLSNPDMRIVWAYNMRRAMLEAKDAGWGKMESPLTFYPSSLARMEPLRERLLEFHRGPGATLSDVDASLKIEELFGAELVDKVCIPSGIRNGVCLLMALCVARGVDTIDLDLTTMKRGTQLEQVA